MTVLIASAAALGIFVLLAGAPEPPAQALVAGSSCPGNICVGQISVGTGVVRYAYTQHVNPNGLFKIRLDGGTCNPGGLISYIIFDMPPFASWGKYAGPGSVYLQEEDVNPGRTAYERRDTDGGGCAGSRIDQVMTVRYSGLADGQYTFNLFVLQNGGSASKNNLEFYVDAGAPNNDNERTSLEPIGGTALTCADREPPGEGGISIDNDLDYKPNCADEDCDEQQGHPINDQLRCEIIEHTCYDDFDNDADGAKDCKDSSCDGLEGRQEPVAYCQYGNEYGAPFSLFGTSPCYDHFDNDADDREDCYDNLYTDTATGATTVYDTPAAAVLQTQICWRHPAYESHCALTEISCTDDMDNDKDRSYSDDDYDYGSDGKPRVPSTGKDCVDYDCAGDPICPDQENHEWQTHVINECQCFDGYDNDLDRLLDCKDPDCVGAYCAITGRICLDKEFDLGQRIQMCNNTFDDDGDGPQDCEDSDCHQKFGDCGPCPAREDYTYEACADNKDNDVNGLKNCEDPRCNGQYDGVSKLGDIANAAFCTAQNGTSEFDSGRYPGLCQDGMDNDGDGRIDCADLGCDLAAGGPAGELCETPAERTCNDGFDNDRNGLIDCLDPACIAASATSGCHAVDWDAAAACIEIERMSPLQTFTANDPTVRVQAFETVHVNAADEHVIKDRVRIKGDDVYTSVTIVIGDNTDINKVYPYTSSSYCQLVDTPGGGGKDQMGTTIVEHASGGGAIMIYNLSGQIISNFDVTMECSTPEQPAALKPYPVSISMLRLGDIPEYGEVELETRLYEATSPAVLSIEAEGEQSGSISVPYNGRRKFRVIPRDPGEPPLFSSGICRCQMDLGLGTEYVSSGGGCVIAPAFQFQRDYDSVTVSASAWDGAANLSAVTQRSLGVNVTPVLTTRLSVEPSLLTPPPSGPIRPFFNKKETANKMDVLGQFTTATNDTFGANCYLYIRNSSGVVVGGPGPINIPNLTAGVIGSEHVANCVDTAVSLPAELLNPVQDTDGIYFATLAVSDSDDNYAESNRQVMFMCDKVPGSDSDPNDGNVCHWADFDSDGAAEGFYTTLYSQYPKACDNCVNLWNPDQDDKDADGFGLDCQGLLGRCEVDTDIVCDKHSMDWTDPDPESPDQCPGDPVNLKCCTDPADPKCCPAPTIKTDSEGAPLRDTQACRPDWGACSTGGEICFVPEDCPKRGFCLAGDSCVEDDCSCNSNNDCLDAEGAPVPDSCVGADLCMNLMYPWVQAPKGNVYSGRYIRAPEPPPPGRANATFCISAKSGVAQYTDPLEPDPEKQIKFVFTSEECGDPLAIPQSRFERPKAKNVYSTVLGRIDIDGLLSNKYGEVLEIEDPAQFAEDYLNDQHLGGRVYLIKGDLHIGVQPEIPPDPDLVVTHEITDAASGEKGGGTVVVLGGNLYFWNNLAYRQTLTGGLTTLSRLASLGWIVLDETDTTSPNYGVKGNVFIGKSVTNLIGAFFVGGQGGVYTVAPPDTDSSAPLTVRGLMVGRQFHFSRSFKSQEQGSERVFYDGRAVANPPPGFGDVTKTLPYFGDTPATP